jgi:hypothetical protein
MQRPGGQNRCPYMDDFPPWMATYGKGVAEYREGAFAIVMFTAQVQYGWKLKRSTQVSTVTLQE